MTKYGFTNTIYIEASDESEAQTLFWEAMDRADIGSVSWGDPVPNCFVTEIESYEELK